LWRATLVGVLAGIACGGGSPAPHDKPAPSNPPTSEGGITGNDSGSSGVDSGSGQPGPPGNDASGSNDASGGMGDGCYPACLAVVMDPCEPQPGACTISSNQTATEFDFAECFADGVKKVTHTDYTTQTSTGQITLNGALCYSFNATGDSPPMTYTYFDANQNTVATMNMPDTSGVVTIACRGQTYTVDLTASGCQTVNAGWGGMGCTEDATCTY
jgi:hypothetical protein